MMQQNVRVVQGAILEIYKVLKDIFERNNIRYYASGGTCLGALRHNGFIPWDDDIDLEIPREDYDRLFDILPRELPNWLQLIDYHNVKDFHVVFAKVVVTDRKRLEQVEDSAKVTLSEGIFVDLFPLDYVPKSKVAQLLRCCKRVAIKLLRRYFTSKENPLLIRLAAGALRKFYPQIKNYNDCLRAEDALLKKYKRTADGYMFLSAWAVYDIHFIKGLKNLRVSDFGDPVSVKFEDTSIPVQANAEKYLTQIYGDWKVWPPVEKRVPMHLASHAREWRLGVRTYE